MNKINIIIAVTHNKMIGDAGSDNTPRSIPEDSYSY
jgi:hypothetical protein